LLHRNGDRPNLLSAPAQYPDLVIVPIPTRLNPFDPLLQEVRRPNDDDGGLLDPTDDLEGDLGLAHSRRRTERAGLRFDSCVDHLVLFWPQVDRLGGGA
jgi:hypothetical protein